MPTAQLHPVAFAKVQDGGKYHENKDRGIEYRESRP